MINLKYTVPVISAHTLISHAEKTGDDKYRFRLALDTDASASAVQMSQQDECAMLHIALKLLKKNGHPQHIQTRDLSSVIVYIDFKGIFDRDPKFTKRDTSYLGRFSFKTLLDFEGIGRIFTIIARGYLFHNHDGSLLDSDAYDRADYAYRALCAWCSIPEKKNATPKAEWQSKSDFREYHEEFPELVNAKGEGWFYRHIHGITRFAKNNPELISDSAQKSCQQLAKGFDKEWRDKVVHYQVSLFTPSTRASWGIRFEGIIADALTLGLLRNEEPDISPELMERVSSMLPKGVPADIVCMLIAYYKANKPDDSDWVVLPVASFDAYYGNTNFSRKYLSKIPEEIMERSEQRLGVSRVKVRTT